MSPIPSHHRARRMALQGLCCLDVQGSSAMEIALQFLRDSRETPETTAEAETLLVNTFEGRSEIDGVLSGESRHWDVGRMALVDRNILRLAVWEMLAKRASRSVLISEAVRLAQEFASVESARFVNGVLDAAARRIHGDDGRDAGKGKETTEQH